MEGILFVVLIAAALWTMYARRKQKQRKQIEKQRGPGRSPDMAEVIHHPRDMETFIRRQRCHCNGRIVQRAEASVPDHKHMRVAVCECSRCEEIHRFYFEIDYLN